MYMTRLVLARHFAYSQVLKLGKERKGAILLDIGCCCAYRALQVQRQGKD